MPFNKKVKSNWALQDFEFAIVLKDFAKPLLNMSNGNISNKDMSGDSYSGSENDLYLLGIVTPSASFSFNFFNNGSTYWKLIGDVSFPFFQNFTTSLGMEVQIYKL